MAPTRRVAATVFGLWGQTSPVGVLAAFLVALWEISLGFWLVVKGFTPSAVTSND